MDCRQNGLSVTQLHSTIEINMLGDRQVDLSLRCRTVVRFPDAGKIDVGRCTVGPCSDPTGPAVTQNNFTIN